MLRQHRFQYALWYRFAYGFQYQSSKEQSPVTEDKVRENRLRRMAKRQGLELHKSRRRDPNALSYGRWMIVNPYNGAGVAGVGPTGEPDLDVDDVELYLTRGPEAFYGREEAS